VCALRGRQQGNSSAQEACQHSRGLSTDHALLRPPGRLANTLLTFMQLQLALHKSSV
jgi:hypothetical protein